MKKINLVCVNDLAMMTCFENIIPKKKKKYTKQICKRRTSLNLKDRFLRVYFAACLTKPVLLTSLAFNIILQTKLRRNRIKFQNNNDWSELWFWWAIILKRNMDLWSGLLLNRHCWGCREKRSQNYLPNTFFETPIFWQPVGIPVLSMVCITFSLNINWWILIM